MSALILEGWIGLGPLLVSRSLSSSETGLYAKPLHADRNGIGHAKIIDYCYNVHMFPI